MSKKILITGKRNIDSLSNNDKKRVDSEKWNKLDLFKDIDMKKQIEYINRLYLDDEYDGKEYIKKEVQRKLRGYKNQDRKKEVFDKRYFISYDELLEKLVVSKLKCYYCRCECKLMYENIREKKQWTLDRLDNDQGHNRDNVVVSCLECNVKKGTMDDEKFKFAKQMRIIKKY
tara:strand:- start:72 stop:590 length:519 start_codon:yes stop_codon:yes gene_type:complete